MLVKPVTAKGVTTTDIYLPGDQVECFFLCKERRKERRENDQRVGLFSPDMYDEARANLA